MKVFSIPLNVDQICKTNRRKTINPKPQYQRTHEGVWTLAKKQLLMDTIFRGFDIPKIYFRKVDDPPYEYEVVDGQQRLRGLWEFYDGNYPLGNVSQDLAQGDLSNRYYADLDGDSQDVFGGFGLSIHEIQDASDTEIRDLFLRLQEGVSLNPPEKRNAMIGELRDYIARIAGEGGGEPHSVFGLTRIPPKRNAWDDLAAHVLRLELEGGPADIKADNLKKMYESNTKFDPKGSVAKKFERILNYMSRVLKESPPEMDIKWGFVDLYLALSVLDDSYVLTKAEPDVAAAFIAFETERREAIAGDPSDLLEEGHDEWDRDLYDYIQAFQREGNKRESVEKRHHVYMRRLLRDVAPAAKDPKRDFTKDERIALYRLAGGRCQECGNEIALEEMHADHIVPYAMGGQTSLANGQCLCAEHNLQKGAK